jgi:threonylcarbamoyladenosine tRNA methylthiotransferase MtaB
VKDSVKKERTKILLQLSETKKNIFYKEHYQTQRPVLFEDDIKNGKIFGFTDNYIRVATPYNESYVNQIINIEIMNYK